MLGVHPRDEPVAHEVFRTLADQVMLVPDEAELAIVLRNVLAAILRFAAGKTPRLAFGNQGFRELAIASIGGCGEAQHPIPAEWGSKHEQRSFQSAVAGFARIIGYEGLI